MPKSLFAQSPLILCLLAGCAVGPDYKRPHNELPEAWPDHELFGESKFENWRNWWIHHSDPTLQMLIERAVAENLEVRLQADRIREAQALLGFTQADRLPTLEAQAEALRERQAGYLIYGQGDNFGEPGALDQLVQIQNGLERIAQSNYQPMSGLELLRNQQEPDFGPRQGPVGNLFSLSAALNYEVDLWGRMARSEEAALALVEQSLFAQDAIRLNVISDVVAAYINLRSVQDQLRITLETIEAREQIVDFERIRYEGGRIDRLPLLQAEAQLEAAKVLIPRLETEVKRMNTVLAVLTGATPAALFEELDLGTGSLPELRLPVGLPEFLPSELLGRRPDIRAAEARVAQASAAIGITQAERFPQLNLRAFLGSTALEVGELFSGPAATGGVGASVMGPLLDFGRNARRVEAAEAVLSQAEVQYGKTIQTAFQEVKTALIAFDGAASRIEAITGQLETLEEIVDLAQLRYEGGYIARIELIDAERTLLEAELLLIEARRDQVLATAGLFKALGGGFVVES